MKTIGPTATTTIAPGSKLSLDEFLDQIKIAGPDDPIYSSGLTVTSLRGLPRSMPNSTNATAGATPSSVPSAANDPDKAPLSERFKQMTPQQMGKLFDDLM